MSLNARWARALRVLETVQAKAHVARSQDAPRPTPRDKALAAINAMNVNINSVPYIHIAGTKGKGTTALYLEDLIRTYHQYHQQPVKVGCLTSPHVIDVRERIRINGAPVSKDTFADRALAMELKLSELPAMFWPTFLTVMAFSIFVEEKVDIAIIETGIGGETDSTNIIEAPIATGITELGMDHTDRLGHSIDQIAWHKAGIMKSGSPCFSVPQCEVATRMLQQRAAEKGTSITVVDQAFLEEHKISVCPNAIYQKLNASLALALADMYASRLCGPGSISASIASCMQRTELPAKYETIRAGGISWVLSSAHNEMSVKQACELFQTESVIHAHCTTAIIFGHDGSRNSETLLRSIYGSTQISGGKPFDFASFCSSEVEPSSISEEQSFHDLRKTPQALSEQRHRSEAIWRGLSQASDTQVVRTVNNAIRSVQEHFKFVGIPVGQTDCVALVIGSAHTAGMARAVLLGLR